MSDDPDPFDKLDYILADFQYMPGWHFELVRPGLAIREYGLLRVTFTAEDSRRPGTRRLFLFQHMVYPQLLQYWSKEEILSWLRACCHAMACHESDEWFRYKGEITYDPHKGEGASRNVYSEIREVVNSATGNSTTTDGGGGGRSQPIGGTGGSGSFSGISTDGSHWLSVSD